MVALDTLHDNLCLWRCIAAHQGALPPRRTQAERELAESNFNLRTAPLNVPKTSLDELDTVERHFNQGKQFSDWFGVRFYEPKLFSSKQQNSMASQKESFL